MARAGPTAASVRRTQYRVALLCRSPATRPAKTLRLKHRLAKAPTDEEDKTTKSAVLAAPLAEAACLALARPATGAPGDRACADVHVKHA